jgi:hypothetical protein
MKRVPWYLGLCLVVPAAGLILLSGCGQSPTVTPPTGTPPAQTNPGTPGTPTPAQPAVLKQGPVATEALASAPAPKYPTTASWTGGISLLGFDVTPLGGSLSRVDAYFACQAKPAASYALTLHLRPANPAVLVKTVPLAVPAMKALLWDFVPVPGTDTWEPGKYYRVGRVGVVPSGGGTWAIEAGLYRAANGKLLEILKRSDAGAAGATNITTPPTVPFD